MEKDICSCENCSHEATMTDDGGCPVCDACEGGAYDGDEYVCSCSGRVEDKGSWTGGGSGGMSSNWASNWKVSK